RRTFSADLDRDGLAFGLTLPPEVVSEIRAYADEATCYADRKPDMGFKLDARAEAEAKIGKPILVAQYLNTTDECNAIRSLSADPLLVSVAANYIGSVPKFLGANLWWTFPVNASEEDRKKHAHMYHRDVDDFRFFKFFFYLTD